MPDTRTRVLVSLDGSERAMKTIDHICRFRPFRTGYLELFSILTPVPESYYDLNKEPFSRRAVSRVKAWESGRKAWIREFMETARNRLVASGFDPDRIDICLADRKNGITRDLLARARQGYDVLISRRRGLGASMLPLALGGVSAKLVDKLDFLPLVLAGTREVTHSLCLAVDGSRGSQRAVAFAARMSQGGDCNIVLCSVLRPLDQAPDTHDPAGAKKLENILEEAAGVLELAGIPRERILTRVIQGAQSRAQAIVETARENRCDTLVLGRKGVSRIDDFDLGRIPRKVIWGARELTVWLVP